MAKKELLYRYSLLVRTLQHKPYQSNAELSAYVERVFQQKELGADKENLGLSSRNLQRDFTDIRELLGYDIRFSRRHRGYHIVDDPDSRAAAESNRMLEAFELTSALSEARNMQPAMRLEQRPSQGTSHLLPLLKAIDQKKLVQFQYQKFWTDAPKRRAVKPLLLKEYRHRWYLLGIDAEANTLRTFAVDRMAELATLNQRFTLDHAAREAIARTQHSYGITVLEGEPEEVVLRFTPLQGKYVATLPLHASQEVVSDDEQGLTVKLRVFISHELEMDLLSFGSEVAVLAPRTLAAALRAAHQAAVDR